MPQPEKIALIGGTGLLDANWFQQARVHWEETPHGTVTLSLGDGLCFLQRHGTHPYTPAHRVNHLAHFQALKQAGVTRIIGVGSVGSLHTDILPGTLVVPDDILALQVNLSFFDDARSHRPPAFDGAWRRDILAAWQQTDLAAPLDGGVYWQTTGPRFETPAEIRFLASHAHLVGMTIASECILAGELGIPYAAICMVDNLANGLAEEALSYAAFKGQVQHNQEKLLRCVNALLHQLMPANPTPPL
ncbi:MAG: MTAP family purine nucleoside phosphorylase [Magnetococcales bacterium]|nr:MTAP family purine nucleoside phosphorylase [Magnetococcales bacterium]